VIDESENPENVPTIYCDMVRFKQIVLNLVSNAIKYTPEGGTVSYISGSRMLEDGRFELSYTIRDNGVGMTPEFMEHMFEKFTRDTENKLRDNTQMGSGLGLYLVKNMVTLMGGTIKYDSELGKGTSVTVTMYPDIATAEELAETKSTEESKAAYGGTYSGNALLVEDNEINMEIAERLIGSMGFEVEPAVDGEKAVEAFNASEEGHFRIVFMDIQMPGMNGYEATRAIRALDRSDAGSVPIVAMTADAFKEAMEESEASGMNGFITKPLIMDQICETLDKLGLGE